MSKEAHERAREFHEAAARLRNDSDWKKIAEMIRLVQGDLDDILRTNTNHDTLMRSAGGWRQLQELLDFMDNARTPDTRTSSGRGFSN